MISKQDQAHGKTLLHWAADTGTVDLVDVLLEAGVSSMIKDVYGGTALHWAAESGHLSIVEALVAAGADVHTKDCQSRHFRTPLDCPRQRGMYYVARFLLEQMRDSEQGRLKSQ